MTVRLQTNAFQITKPALLLDKKRVLRNIKRMADKASACGVSFRPHCKTHQSAEIGNWLKNVGAMSIAVSSVEMAQYFRRHGWTDIQIAFPANLLEITEIDRLALKADIALLVDSEAAAKELDKGLSNRVRVWLKVDVGYGRSGVSWQTSKRLAKVTQAILSASNLEFEGILTHSGHSYGAKTVEEIRAIHAESLSRLQHVKTGLMELSPPRCRISVGDTPTCSVADDFLGVDEIRPGNFVFYDLMQQSIGSCAEDDMAVGLACPVVGVYKDRGQLVLYGGAAHLYKDFIEAPDGTRVFGFLADVTPDSLGRPNRTAPVISLSQEHGIVQVEKGLLEKIRVGDVVVVFPAHSCLTGKLHNEYITLQGEKITRM